MDALTIPRLKARVRAQGQARKLASEAQRGGEEGRAASERLGRFQLPRPTGPLVWVHAPPDVDLRALASLRERLDDDLPGITILLTSDRPPDGPINGLQHIYPPLEAPRSVGRFLDHWTPDAAIWIREVNTPLLLEGAARRGIPLFMQDAVAPEAASPRVRNLQRRLFGLFDRIFAIDRRESDSIRSLGAIPARIESTGPLTRVAHPPECIEAERAALATALDTRPVWLACCPAAPEIDTVLRAHRVARRNAHRLLLILVPEADHLGAPLAKELAAAGWNVARRDADEDPDNRTDIFVADCLEELGLYYRLSPITFLGGTLAGADVPGAMNPATLGSAIVTGPHPGNERRALERLGRGGACRQIHRPDDLGPVVSELLAPDKAAVLALNGWDIATEGVQVLDRLAHQVVAAVRNRSV